MCEFVSETIYVYVYKHKIVLVSFFKIRYDVKITTSVIICIRLVFNINNLFRVEVGGGWVFNYLSD